MLLSEGYRKHTAWFVSLEIFVNFTLVAEVIIRMFGQGKAYWKACGNAFDFVVMVFCLSTFFGYLQRNRGLTPKERDDVTVTLIRMFRDISQYLRLMLFVKNRQSMALFRSSPSIEISFTNADFGYENPGELQNNGDSQVEVQQGELQALFDARSVSASKF
eukprot:c33594_g1_i1.p1 GENE.c33594_g1_i1~~c33594_g1_i1.p1  ORF type:complete len:161 (+),score=39.73 c33594_g1_i1:2-484(+)